MSTPHKPTLRVLSVLELVANSGLTPYTLSELSARLDIPPSTLLPIVHTLRDRQYLSFDERNQSYSLGLRIFELGSMIQATDYYSSIVELMRNVVDGCGETCHFGILSGGDVLYLAKVNSPRAIRMFSMMGRRLPAYSTGIGKALLRDFEKEELQALYPKGLTPLMPHTVTDFDELYRQVLQIRAEGFAYENEESNENIRCIAVPLCVNGRVRAAMSVAVPVFRYSEELRKTVERLLKETAPLIENILPYRVL